MTRRPDIIRVATLRTPREARLRVVAEIAALHGVPRDALLAPDGQNGARCIELVQARWHAMAEVQRRFGDGLHRLGALFGDRHHTTVLSGIRRWREIEAKELAA